MSDDMNGSKIQIKVPLDEWARDIALEAGREGAREIMSEHMATREETCPLTKRLDKVRLRLWLLIAFLGGLGILNAWAMLK